MFQPQITTSPTASKSRPLRFAIKIAGKPIERVVRKTIFVHCELCSEQATGTREELQANRWGIYLASAFCPFHEEMV